MLHSCAAENASSYVRNMEKINGVICYVCSVAFVIRRYPITTLGNTARRYTVYVSQNWLRSLN
jgi:hypothetical protein